CQDKWRKDFLALWNGDRCHRRRGMNALPPAARSTPTTHHERGTKHDQCQCKTKKQCTHEDLLFVVIKVVSSISQGLRSYLHCRSLYASSYLEHQCIYSW